MSRLDVAQAMQSAREFMRDEMKKEQAEKKKKDEILKTVFAQRGSGISFETRLQQAEHLCDKMGGND